MICGSPCCRGIPGRVQVRSVAQHCTLDVPDIIICTSHVNSAALLADLSRARAARDAPSFLEWWFSKPPMSNRPRVPGLVQDKPEPKTYFANERTFLSWLHMALTMGSIAAAMLGFSTGGKGDPVSWR